MKKYVVLILTLGSLFAVAPIVSAQDRAEVGVFVDYFRLSDASPAGNFVGFGGRAAFNIRPTVQVEAEMAYDFVPKLSAAFTDGSSTETVNVQFKTLHGFFGPKFQTGSGPFRFFVTGKVGFDNFTLNNSDFGTGLTSTIGLTAGTTAFAVYPGAGVEMFAGRLGVRAEVGDDIYFLDGAHHNLRVTLGPQFRF
jgi:hypothetical protein